MPKKRNPYLSPQDIATLLSSSSPEPPQQPPSPPNHSTSSIYALGNPLIVNSIFEYLSPKDINACLSVCKVWNTFAQPHHWRSICHHYTFQGDLYEDPFDEGCQWWEWRHSRRFGYPSEYGVDLAEFHSSPHAIYITDHRKDLIRRNAHRVRSLRIDYSASNLLDLPFTSLTRINLNCRYSHSCHSLISDPGQQEDMLFRKTVLKLIVQNPRLQEIELSYCDKSYYRFGSIPSVEMQEAPFAISVLQALRQHYQPSSSASSLTGNGSLYSLKITQFGPQSLNDICSIIENSPSSLRELILHNRYRHGFASHDHDPGLLQQRLAFIRDSNNPASPQHRRTPRLRLLDISWFNIDNFTWQPPGVDDPETFYYPLLACFPDLQDLTLPSIACSHYNGYHGQQISIDGASVITALTLHCPILTTVNFGRNMISEKQMLRFIMAMPEALQGLTMIVHSDYMDRVMPTLLQRSGPTLEILHLEEHEHDGVHNRSIYIADIFSSCPRLKVLTVRPSWKPSTTSQGSSAVGLQDLLRAEWVCSRLETLALGIMELAGEDLEDNDYVAEWKEGDDTEGGEHYPPPCRMSTTDTAQHVHYLRKVDNVAQFYRRLKALPNLTSLALEWDNLCHDIPYDPFEYEIDFSDNLRWMGLRWSTVRDRNMTCAQEAMQRLLDKKKDLAFQHRMADMGIYVFEVKRDGWRNWRRNWGYDPRWSGNHYPDERFVEEEALFEGVQEAYKSQGHRRRRFDILRRKK
ncbi:hypothetical protein BGW39_005707 [Mortierella sp. 14UC]|nr:hypothetical protein BGW39_005707 [Mortierella sp. 14UC]